MISERPSSHLARPQEQTLALAGLSARDEPERETRTPRPGPTKSPPLDQRCFKACPQCPTGRTRSPRGAHPAVRIRRRRPATPRPSLQLLTRTAQASSPPPPPACKLPGNASPDEPRRLLTTRIHKWQFCGQVQAPRPVRAPPEIIGDMGGLIRRRTFRSSRYVIPGPAAAGLRPAATLGPGAVATADRGCCGQHKSNTSPGRGGSNTRITRTRRHSPAHVGTPARLLPQAPDTPICW
jgi:hypothetical protein